MSKKDKLLKTIKNNPKDVSFNDLKKLLENYGYQANNTGGSHWVFRKQGAHEEVVPRKNPVKPYYVIRALKSIDEQSDE